MFLGYPCHTQTETNGNALCSLISFVYLQYASCDKSPRYVQISSDNSIITLIIIANDNSIITLNILGNNNAAEVDKISK